MQTNTYKAKNSKLSIVTYSDGEIQALSHITNGKLKGKEICILDYKPSKYVTLDIEMTNYSKTLSSHYTKAIAYIFKDHAKLYNHVTKLYNEFKEYDIFVNRLERFKDERQQCHDYLMSLYIDKLGLLHARGGISNIHVKDVTIAKYSQVAL